MVDIIEIACEDGTWLQRAVLELAVVLPPFSDADNYCVEL